MMRSAWASVSDTAIVQMQDLLGLGHEARINTPSTLSDNWTWRCKPEDISDELAKQLYEEMKIYERLPQISEAKGRKCIHIYALFFFKFQDTFL